MTSIARLRLQSTFWLRTIFSELRARQDFHKEWMALSDLNDAQLRDIGLTRADVEAADPELHLEAVRQRYTRTSSS